MSNQKGFSKILIIIVVVFVIFIVWSSYVKYPKLYKGESNGINPKDYSLVNYPIAQSPVYRNDKNCDINSLYNPLVEDLRLVKKEGEVLVPSLLQLISGSYKLRLSCSKDRGYYVDRFSLNAFSAPTDGKYLYLYFGGLYETGIYRLDLSNLSVKKLSFTDSLKVDKQYDSESNSYDRNYEILPDGKRLIKWNTGSIFLANLETDSIKALYIAPKNQWFVSRFGGDPSEEDYINYDIKLDGNKIIVGLYDKTKTQEGEPIVISQDGDLVTGAKGINPRFINRATISIPDNR